MNWIHKLIKARNIKWLIRWHQEKREKMWRVGKEHMDKKPEEQETWLNAIEVNQKPHNEEISRLLTKLEEL